MNLKKMSQKEKLELAISTNTESLLMLLALSPEMLVRRILLRNKNITTEITNILAFDVTENVSYMALQHSKCTKNRIIDEPVSKCVRCTVDERKLSCNNCFAI
jgi:hypothetical protein